MILATMHPEDVKAAIRKQYGTVSRFVEAHDLPPTSVTDLFRGRTSKRVSDAIEKLLSERRDSTKPHVSKERRRAQLLYSNGE